MARRSVSQYLSYIRCPQQYYLERIQKVPRPPDIWSHAGTAFHSACDVYDMGSPSGAASVDALNDAVTHFEDEFLALLGAEEVATATASADFARTGVTKDRPEGCDLNWWMAAAPDQIKEYATWRHNTQWALAEAPDGSPIIETQFELDFGNGTSVSGGIDRVYVRPDGSYIVVDLKTGMSQPGLIQLGTYALACDEALGLDVPYGAFYMSRKDGLAKVHWLNNIRRFDTLAEIYHRLDEAIESNTYVPVVGMNCLRCQVKEFCQFAIDR